MFVFDITENAIECCSEEDKINFFDGLYNQDELYLRAIEYAMKTCIR